MAVSKKKSAVGSKKERSELELLWAAHQRSVNRLDGVSGQLEALREEMARVDAHIDQILGDISGISKAIGALPGMQIAIGKLKTAAEYGVVKGTEGLTGELIRRLWKV